MLGETFSTQTKLGITSSKAYFDTNVLWPRISKQGTFFITDKKIHIFCFWIWILWTVDFCYSWFSDCLRIDFSPHLRKKIWAEFSKRTFLRIKKLFLKRMHRLLLDWNIMYAVESCYLLYWIAGIAYKFILFPKMTNC